MESLQAWTATACTAMRCSCEASMHDGEYCNPAVVQEREQLTGELAKAHTLIEETAADRLEATELLSRAVQIMESMREHMTSERGAMWQCILQLLHLQPQATPAEASACFAR